MKNRASVVGVMADHQQTGRLRDVQDVEINYYVLVPFTTYKAAEWCQGEIDYFDSHIVGRAAVNQKAIVYRSDPDA